MKILDIMSNCPTPALPAFYGGAEVSRQLFCDVLIAGGHEVVSVRGHKSALPEEFDRGRRVLTIPFPARTPPTDVGGLSPLGRIAWHARDDHNEAVWQELSPIMEAERPDVVLTANLNGLSSAVWSLASSLNLPAVHYLHDHYLMCHRTVRYRRERICETTCPACSCLTYRRRRATASVQCVIANSSYLLDQHTGLGLFPNARTFVQPPYVHADGVSRRPAREGGRMRMGFLGRISPEKGLEALIAARRIMRTPTDLIVGGPVSDEVRARLSALSPFHPITFAGLVDPSNFLSEIDLLVVPSLMDEPFGRVVLEAWSAGVPVAAANRGGLVGLVPPDWRCEPTDLPGFARFLDALCNNPARLAFEGRRVAIEAQMYTSSRMLDVFEDAFGHAMSAAGRPMAASGQRKASNATAN